MRMMRDHFKVGEVDQNTLYTSIKIAPVKTVSSLHSETFLAGFTNSQCVVQLTKAGLTESFVQQ